MLRKLEYSYIKNSFEEEGYQLLTTEYMNNRQKLDYICSNGHRHSIMWNDWKKGHRCKQCNTDRQKLTIEFIRSEFEKESYVLLTTEYKNNMHKLDYICPNSHQHSIKWNDWQQGHRCPVCIGLAKLNIDLIKLEFEKESYVLLTAEYKNGKQKLDYICPNGHHHSIRWNDWQQGHRCSTCANIKLSGHRHPNWQGGISCAPYCDVWADKEYKSDIKLRDGNVCLNPYCFNISKRLHIHHIDYDKKNCAPQNLITVCNSCNSKANSERGWHTGWYRNILNRRYGYKY